MKRKNRWEGWEDVEEEIKTPTKKREKKGGLGIDDETLNNWKKIGLIVGGVWLFGKMFGRK